MSSAAEVLPPAVAPPNSLRPRSSPPLHLLVRPITMALLRRAVEIIMEGKEGMEMQCLRERRIEVGMAAALPQARR
jgi:hypothetical protein